jgi:hypothetical protein
MYHGCDRCNTRGTVALHVLSPCQGEVRWSQLLRLSPLAHVMMRPRDVWR